MKEIFFVTPPQEEKVSVIDSQMDICDRKYFDHLMESFLQAKEYPERRVNMIFSVMRKWMYLLERISLDDAQDHGETEKMKAAERYLKDMVMEMKKQ